MTIEEAISHCEGRALADCSECADEHRQLAEWLAELKKYKWIPISEQLPVNGKIVLVTRQCQNKNWYVEQDEYYDDTGFESGADENIVAWMPLPEPYRPY